ncbi:MAG: FkbM family methyltransferase [Pseudomonadota bacterium]
MKWGHLTIAFLMGTLAATWLIALIYQRVLEPPEHLGLPQVVDSRDFSIAFYGMTFRGNSGDLIDSHVLQYGAFEKHILYFMRDAATRCRRTAQSFVDVGANIGQHSMFMSKVMARVEAFEPFPPVLARLQAHVTDNALSNVVIHSVGLGDREAELPFFYPEEGNHGTGTFETGFAGQRTASANFKIVTGDSILATDGAVPAGIIKIDVEGFEQPVLWGLHGTLLAHRPVVVVELSSGTADAIQNIEQLRALFPPDYRFGRIERLGGFAGGYYEIHDEVFGDYLDAEVVAYPDEDADCLRPTNVPERIQSNK